MIESFLSKFVMGVCAILVIAAVSSSFAGTQEEADINVADETLKALSDLICSVASANEPMRMLFDLHPFMFQKFESLEMTHGSISLLGDSRRLSVEVPENLVFQRDSPQGIIIEKLEVWPPASIIIERRMTDEVLRTVIYVENLDATSVTSSVNLSHSSTVL
jgi:hypothetical protein